MTSIFKKTCALVLLLTILCLSTNQAQDNLSYSLPFETAQSKLPKTLVDTLVTQLQTWKSYKIVLEGHTDNIGTTTYNQALSQARVDEIKSILVQHQIDSNRIITLASGANKPIADNNTQEGRAKNRRVDILVTTQFFDKKLVLEKTQQLNAKLSSLMNKRGMTHRINPNVEQIVVAKQGTKIKVPANAFDVPANAKVLLKVTEVYQKSDMILQNLATVSDGHALETGGMIKIEAFANGQPIQLKEGMALDVEVPTEEIEDEMQLFASEVAEDGSINWVRPQPLARQTQYIPPPSLNWNISIRKNYLPIEPQEPENPDFRKAPRPIDSTGYFQLIARKKELQETPYKGYKNYKTVKGLFGKRKVKKSVKDSIDYLVTVEKMIKSIESKIAGKKKRMQDQQKYINAYASYLEALEKHRQWEEIKDSIFLKNLVIATENRHLRSMEIYSTALKGTAYYQYWSNVYGLSIMDFASYNAMDFEGEIGDSLLCRKAIKEQDTLAVNMIRRQKYKERLLLSIYQTKTTEEAYIAHCKYREYARYKAIADRLGISIEEAIKQDRIQRKWEEKSSYLFQMANLGQYINCDFFPRMAPQELLVSAQLNLPPKVNVTKTMMVFQNYNTVMRANVGTYTNSSQCTWRNVPLNEPVKVISIYIDENAQMQVAIQKLNIERTLPALEYQPMTEEEFLRALSGVNDLAIK